MYAFLLIAGASGVLALGYQRRTRAMLIAGSAAFAAIVAWTRVDPPWLWPSVAAGAILGAAGLVIRLFHKRVGVEEVATQRAVAQGQEERVRLLLEIDRLRDEASAGEQAVRELGELYDFSKAINASLDFSSLFEWLAYLLIRHFTCQRCTLILFNPAQGYPVVERVYFTSEQGLPTIRPEPALEGRESRWVQGVGRRPGEFEDGGVKVSPLFFQQQVTGLVAFEGVDPKSAERLRIVVDQFARGTEKVRLYERVQEMAIIDHVTRVYSRRHLMNWLEEEVQRAGRLQESLSSLVIDIDEFKLCNDRFGHLVGDRVLQEVARMIKSQVREIDLVARYGGDEFVVLLAQSHLEDAMQVGKRIREAIASAAIQAYDETIRCTVSVGAAEWSPELDQAAQLIEMADQAMYEAKRRGRNQVWPQAT